MFSNSMKNVLWIVALAVIVISCQKSELVSEYTGNEASYALMPGSDFPVSGLVTFKERKDGSTTVVVSLTGTNGSQKLPVHLHLGDIGTPDADIAALLSPVDAQTGRSETILTALADESKVNYTQLIALAACVKIHLDSTGPGRDVILAAGNIGANASKSTSNGRISIGVCSSN